MTINANSQAYKTLKLIREAAEYARAERYPENPGTTACRYANTLDTVIAHVDDYERLIGKKEDSCKKSA